MAMVKGSYAPWLERIYEDIVVPRRRDLQKHPFIFKMQTGTASRGHAKHYFSGLMWHLLDFGKHVQHLREKRPPVVSEWLAGRSEDTDGDTGILARCVDAFGGDSLSIAKTPYFYQPHQVWINHDALLRSAIYSRDLPWQVGTAALNIGIESMVPWMVEPLFKASIEKYGVRADAAAWLESRSGEAERQHGENGFLILNRAVDEKDIPLQALCRFYIESLSRSMAYELLESGLPPSESRARDLK